MSAPERIHLDALHPYPGPSSFDEDHAAYFCGRDREAEELFALVDLRSLTVVYGKSGLGKTSLLQAGLFPRLRKAGLVPIRIRLLFGVDERGERHPPLVEQVRARLREAVERGELDGAPPRGDESLWEYFHWTGFWDEAGRPVQAVLVLDQFEEVFTLGHERRRELLGLMRELADVVENRIPAALREGGAALPPSYDAVGAKVLIALREEFLAQLDDYRPQMPSLASGRYRLRPLGGLDALSAVLDPGREVVTEDVAERIVRRLANAPDDTALADVEEVEPALLALYCHELNALRHKAALPKIDVALLAGSEKEILDKFYDRCMAGMPKEVHRLVEERLLTPDDRRDTIAFGRAVDLGVDPKHLTALVDRRLLRKVPLLGHEYVQIVHDKLVPTIARRRDARVRRDLAERVARKVVRRVGTGVILLSVIAAAGILDWRCKRQEVERAQKVAEAQARVASAEARARDHAALGWRAAGDGRWDDVARLLSTAVAAVGDANEARGGLPRQSAGRSVAPPELGLLASRFEASAGRIEALLGDRGGVDSFAVSKDGRRAAAIGADGRTITLIDLKERTWWPAGPPGALGTIDDQQPDRGPPIEAATVFAGAVRDLVLSGDGETLLGLGDKGQVAVFRVADGTRLGGFRARLSRPTIQVDRSGRRVLVWDRDVDRAFVVTLDAGAEGGLESLELVTRRPRPKAPGPGRWDHSTDWLDLVLAADGSRVVGFCEVSSRQLSRKAAAPVVQTEIALWDLPSAEPVTRFALPGHVESPALSENGALLALLSDDRQLRVLSLDAQRIAPRGAPRALSAEAWFAFQDPQPALMVADEKTLSLWDLSGEPAPRFEIPLGGRARRAALSPDAAQALVLLDDEVRLYDTKLGQPRAGVWLPEPERRHAAGADVHLRYLPGEALVVTAKGDAVRVRALGGADPPRPADRWLWGESPVAKATAAASIPRGSVVEDVDGDGEELAVLADGAVFVVRSPAAGKLEIVPLETRSAAAGKSLAAGAGAQDQSVRALGLRARHVAAFDAGGALRVSDARFSTLRRAPSEAGWGGLLAISRDGAWIATGGRGPQVRVWDADDGALAWEADVRRRQSKAPAVGPDVEITAVAVTADASDRPRAIVGDANGGVRAVRTDGDDRPFEWSLETFGTSPHGTSPVRAIEVGADGRIATAADDGTIAIWDRDGKPTVSAVVLPPSPVRALRFADEGRFLIGAAGETVRVFRTSDGAQECAIPHAGAVRDIAVESPAGGVAGARVASVDAGGTAIVWKIPGCAPLRVLRGMAYAGFLSTARDNVVTVRRTGRVELWPASDLGTDDHGSRPSGASTWGVALGAGGLVTGDEENAVFGWRPDGPSAMPARLGGELGGVVAAVSAGDRAVVATAEGVLRTWSGDPPGEAVTARLPLDRGLALRAAALDAQGRRLFTIEDGPDDRPRARVSQIGALGVQPGTPIPLAGGDVCGSLPAGPAGRFFAAADTQGGLRALVVESSGCIRIWNEEGKREVEALGPDTSDPAARVSAAAIERSGLRVVLGASDGAVSTWSIEAGPAAGLRRVATERRRHTGRIRAVAFHPDGRFFVTAGDDGQAWLWDGQDGRALARLGVHPAPIAWLAFRPDGAEVVTGGAGGFVRAFATRTRADDMDRLGRALRAFLPELGTQ